MKTVYEMIDSALCFLLFFVIALCLISCGFLYVSVSQTVFYDSKHITVKNLVGIEATVIKESKREYKVIYKDLNGVNHIEYWDKDSVKGE